MFVVNIKARPQGTIGKFDKLSVKSYSKTKDDAIMDVFLRCNAIGYETKDIVTVEEIKETAS